MDNVIHYIKGEISSVYEPCEAAAIARIIAEECFGITLVQAYAGLSKDLSTSEKEQLRQILSRLKRHEPLQYILGSMRFMGHTFHVAPGVLIPRPETEELVRRVLHTYNDVEAPCLMDVGTGSGCIAISLKLALPKAHVIGVDISDEALVQARSNAKKLCADVGFFMADVLKPYSLSQTKVDALVSNPPYIRHSEMQGMDAQVKDYEPHEALFVPDESPLIFYDALAEWGKGLLNDGGRIFVEINSALGTETAALFKSHGYSDVVVETDQFGKERMVSCRK